MLKFIIALLLTQTLQNAIAQLDSKVEFQPWVIFFDQACKEGKIEDVDASNIIVKSCSIPNLKNGSVLASFNLKKTFKVVSFTITKSETKIKYTPVESMNDVYKKIEFSGKTPN